MMRPATISQIGASLGKRPAWVRHHILRLVAAGLAEPSEVRVDRNYTEKCLPCLRRIVRAGTPAGDAGRSRDDHAVTA